jgi:ferrochelatase
MSSRRPRFRSPARTEHGQVPAIGVLVANLGTPTAPTARALRRYLAEFLADPRVIELPRLAWWLILHSIVLRTRPAKSAALYSKVWDEKEGSPLLAISRRQAAGIAARLADALRLPVHVALGMRYGEPSLAAALGELDAKGCHKLLVLPLYPQYSGPTIGSTFDGVTDELRRWRWVPELRTVNGYHDEPGYIAALAASVDELWRRDGQPDKLVFSFHGMPRRYFESGDPYYCLCQKTARLVAERLGLAPEQWIVSFQSLFGKEEWLRPYTDQTMRALPGLGAKRVDVLSPAFSADCLETLEELDGLNREFFMHAGGERYRYIPCLNDRADHLDFLAELALENLHGWDATPGVDAVAEAAGAARRSEALRTRLPG